MARHHLGRAALLTLVTALACKPPATGASTAKSLENYVAADGTTLVRNECEGPYVNDKHAAAEYVEVPEALRADFHKALSSIPLGLREMFATGMIGKFTVTPEATQLCGAASTDLAEGRLRTGGQETTTCLKASAGQPGVELILPANPASLRHTLVRAFFAATFRVMAVSTYDKRTKLFSAGKADPELAKIERSVTLALREDLLGSGVDERGLRRIFGRRLAAATSGGAMATAYDQTPKAERGHLALGVIREAADQYYCSAATRVVMRAKFPKTYDAFRSTWVRTMHAVLEEKNPEELLGEPARGDGLGLAGSGGSGPLRAWGEARQHARAEGGVGPLPNWSLARQQGVAAGGTGAAPTWAAVRQSARAELNQAGRPATSLFPGFWANRFLGD